MKKGLMGKKLGMTQIFDEDGTVIPVTVIKAGPCSVVQKKTEEQDGYKAVQLGFEEEKKNKVNKPLKGHFDKSNVEYKRYLAEFKMESHDDLNIGDDLTVEQFEKGDLIDVTGTTKGKGFAGSIKRHNQATGPMTHGSRYHRGPGSLGAIAPARVFKGQTLPGRMGGTQVTVQKLEIVKVDPDKNLLLVKGAVPGPKNGLVKIIDSVKA